MKGDVIMDVNDLARKIIEAEEQVRSIGPITEDFPQISMNQAYRVQMSIINEKLSKGNKVVGKKIGLTSNGMQKLLGVNEPDYGHLLDNMIIPEGGVCPRDELLNPKVEGEIAFILKHDLKGPGITIADVYRATEGVFPAIEIVDSRIINWQIKIQDTIADNASSARFVLGSRMYDIKDLDLRCIGMYIEKNGSPYNSGTGVEVLGSPAMSVAWLANKLSEYDIPLKAGEIILSGAITAAAAAERNDIFYVHFDKLGTVSVKFA